MNRLKGIIILLVLLAGFSADSFAKNVYEVKGVEIKFKHFNAQRTRASAVDYAAKKGFFVMLNDIVLEKYDTEQLKKEIDFKKDSLVEKINIVSEDTSKGGYWAKFDILYNQDKVKRILKDKRIPFTQESMGKVLVIPIKEDFKGARFLFEEMNDFKYVLEDSLKKTNLLETVFPKGGLDEVTSFSPYGILDAYNSQKLLDFVKRYETDKIMIVLLSKKDVLDKNSYNLHIKFINIDSLTTYSSLVIGQNIKGISDQIAKKVKDLWKESHLLEFDKPKKLVASVATNGDLDKFDDIVNKLNEISTVSDVTISKLNRQEAEIYTMFYGSPKEFLEETEKAGLRVFQTTEGKWLVDYKQNSAEQEVTE
ncbi:MAG: DUF2066 domain-containing protein [Proteobacteria bacterium]|nr:DUF2066 domain-containing protein [Pseudomonadota bacterium]